MESRSSIAAFRSLSGEFAGLRNTSIDDVYEVGPRVDELSHRAARLVAKLLADGWSIRGIKTHDSWRSIHAEVEAADQRRGERAVTAAEALIPAPLRIGGPLPPEPADGAYMRCEMMWVAVARHAVPKAYPGWFSPRPYSGPDLNRFWRADDQGKAACLKEWVPAEAEHFQNACALLAEEATWEPPSRRVKPRRRGKSKPGRPPTERQQQIWLEVQRHHGNKSAAARALGMNAKSVWEACSRVDAAVKSRYSRESVKAQPLPENRRGQQDAVDFSGGE